MRLPHPFAVFEGWETTTPIIMGFPESRNDALNRIATGYTTGTNWGEDYTLDAWGNLTNKSPVAGKMGTQNLNAAPASVKNQLNGFCNDAAGNLVLNTACPTGTFTPTYSYDIENRLMSAAAGYSYIYDGDGRRVKKCSNAGCTGGTLYWTGMGSDPLAESSVGGTFSEQYIFLMASGWRGETFRAARCIIILLTTWGLPTSLRVVPAWFRKSQTTSRMAVR